MTRRSGMDPRMMLAAFLCLMALGALVAPVAGSRTPAFQGGAGPGGEPGGEGWQVLAGPGSGPGEFREPYNLALDGQGNIYVADFGNNRIQKLSPDGEPLAQWGSQGDGPGQFLRPTGVAVDGPGNIYVADAGSRRIQKLSPAGEPLAHWDTERPAPGQLGPHGVALDGARPTSTSRTPETTGS